MRDHLSEDLLSAYIDGELAGDERELVERRLAESAEQRELCDELQRLRESFQGLPKYQLSDDFHRRVMAEIERVKERDAERVPAFASGSNRSKSLWWQAALGVSAIAAAIAFAVFLESGPDDPDVVIEQNRPQRDLFTPDDSWYDEQFVYYIRPSQRAPTFTMLVDLVVTPEGQASFALHNAFRRAEVVLDPEMAVDESLEEALLASRMVAKVRPTGGQGDDHDSVELYYIVCESDKADDILRDLRSRPHETSLQLDLVVNSQELEMLYQLNRSSVAQFAGTKSSKEKRSLVHRLAFSVRLGSTSLPTLMALEQALGGQKVLAQEAPAERTPHMARLESAPTELLFVVRNLKEPTEE